MHGPAQRRLAWEGSYNIRDLGGLPTVDGRVIRRGALVRADNLSHLTLAGQAALVEYGIGTIIDVRSNEECATRPHAFSRHATIHTVNIPFGTGADADAQEELDAASDLADWSRLTLQHCQPAIAQLVTQLAQAPPGGVLIHCHAGKDRTGLAVALVLALVGVEPALIAADYAASAEGLQPLFTQWLAAVAHDEAQHAALALQLTAHPETMLAVLAELDTGYGGVHAYLEQCGVGEAERNAVRQRLCAKPGE
jgi:protein-tyrosine phosphatase